MITYTLAEVSTRDGKQSPKTWIIIRDMVYDVTDFLDEHPGGGELITEYAGKDATKEFDDFGHSGDAMQMLKKLKVGELVEADKKCNRMKKIKEKKNEAKSFESEVKKRIRSIGFMFCR